MTRSTITLCQKVPKFIVINLIFVLFCRATTEHLLNQTSPRLVLVSYVTKQRFCESCVLWVFSRPRDAKLVNSTPVKCFRTPAMTREYFSNVHLWNTSWVKFENFINVPRGLILFRNQPLWEFKIYKEFKADKRLITFLYSFYKYYFYEILSNFLLWIFSNDDIIFYVFLNLLKWNTSCLLQMLRRLDESLTYCLTNVIFKSRFKLKARNTLLQLFYCCRLEFWNKIVKTNAPTNRFTELSHFEPAFLWVLF